MHITISGLNKQRKLHKKHHYIWCSCCGRNAKNHYDVKKNLHHHSTFMKHSHKLNRYAINYEFNLYYDTMLHCLKFKEEDMK